MLPPTATDALREKQVAAKPLRDVVSAAAAAQSEVRDMSRDLRARHLGGGARGETRGARVSHVARAVGFGAKVDPSRRRNSSRERRADVKHLVEKRATLAEGRWDTDTASAQLKVMRSLIDFLRRQQEETKRSATIYTPPTTPAVVGRTLRRSVETRR